MRRGLRDAVRGDAPLGAGSVFHSSLGHTVADLDVPEVGELQRPGMLSAAR